MNSWIDSREVIGERSCARRCAKFVWYRVPCKMVTCVIIAKTGTLSNPNRGSCSATKSADEMLARSIALSLHKLSVVRRLSASLRSHTLIVSELAVVAGVGGMTTTGRGNSAAGRATSSFGTRLPGS